MAVQRRSSIDVTPVRTPGASHVPYTTAPQAYSDTINAWTQTFDATAIHPRSRFDEEQLTSAATVQDFASPCQARTDLLSNALHRSIAPVFPELNDTNEFFPLLANLTDGDLSDDERLLRASYRHHDDIIPTPLYSDNQIRSDIRTLLNSHAKKWRVDASVLIANLNRLFTILPRLTLKDFILKQQQQPYALSIDEWFIALEFYLQMDVKCFFMKTCTFRHAQARSMEEGLFCHRPPFAHYGMQQCRDKSCRFCYERVDLTKRRERAMRFSTTQVHACLNQYQIYLNSNVTCTTSNTIYILTCPCREYDYVGRCLPPFRDRMWNHRMKGCRWMSNAFIGPAVADRLQDEREPNPTFPDGQIKLYRHSSACPVALHIFLKCHPDYWCFVPMTVAQAAVDDVHLATDAAPTHVETNARQRETSLVLWCVDHVPSPTVPDYVFSQRQRVEQFCFFRDRLDLYPSRYLDLYNAAIVMALPENSTDDLCHLLHALVVAHVQPKLNVTTDDPEAMPVAGQSSTCWYEPLVHPRHCKIPRIN